VVKTDLMFSYLEHLYYRIEQKEIINMYSKKIKEYLNEINMNRYKILEDFTKAYIAESGLKPSDIELVEEKRGLNVVYYFKRKT